MRDSLRPYRQIFVKGTCLEIKFSNGGHLLGAVVRKQGPVNLYCIVYRALDLSMVFSGLVMSTEVGELTWSPDDDCLYLVGEELVFIWARTWDNYLKLPGHQVSALAVSPTAPLISTSQHHKHYLSVLRPIDHSL
jgi:hypothetical protein